jgi:hypothetical protein
VGPQAIRSLCEFCMPERSYFSGRAPNLRFQPNRARIRAAISLGVNPLSIAGL